MEGSVSSWCRDFPALSTGLMDTVTPVAAGRRSVASGFGLRAPPQCLLSDYKCQATE